MTKAPEEGRIWEWRAFGRISERLSEKIESYPVRMGIKDMRGEDIYLISPVSDQNVKLRSSLSSHYLKFKLLLETRPGAIELYSESVARTYSFPVSIDVLREAALLLKVTLPAEALASSSFSEDETAQVFASASPAAWRTDVKKVRSQYTFSGGWLETGLIDFKQRREQTLSIHSEDFKVVKEMIDALKPGAELEPMNYIEACRRWGR